MTKLTQSEMAYGNARAMFLTGAPGDVADTPDAGLVAIPYTCAPAKNSDSRTTKMQWQTILNMIPASAALLAGTFGFLVSQAVPATAAEPTVCEGSAYYCDQFAYNCTLNNGRFINFRPHNQRIVAYGCELPENVSADLFTSNVANTWIVPIGGENNNDDSGDEPSNNPGQGTPNPTNPGGDDDIPGQDDPDVIID